MAARRNSSAAAVGVPPQARGYELVFGFMYGFYRPRPMKNRCHPDLEANDPEAEVARLVALGASHVDVGQTGDEGFVVLIDPEGNEFCVLGAGN
jgi:hypothetical protein